MTVAVENNGGAVQTGDQGTVTLAIPSNPGGGSLGGTLTVTISAGVARFSGLTLDQAATGYILQASTTGQLPVTAIAFGVNPAPASQLVLSTQPPDPLTAGSPFGLTVTAEDPFGNVATSFNGSVAIALQSNLIGAPLHGAFRSSRGDVATFAALTLNPAGNGYTIQATATGLTAAATTAFNVAPGTASQLVITTTPPSSLPAGSPFGLVVAAEYPFGNVDPRFAGSVMVSLRNDPGGAVLGGTSGATAGAGVPRFAGLTLDQAARGYTIQDTAPGLAAIAANPFDITPAASKWAVNLRLIGRAGLVT